MHKKSFHYIARAGVGVTLTALLAACGGGSNNNVVQNDPIQADTIRGAINTVLPSTTLASGAIPSFSLPSRALTSTELPSQEVEDGSATLRTTTTTLTAQQEVALNFNAEANVNATATGSLVIDSKTGAVSGSVTAGGLDTGETITAVHIHSGFAGANGPVLIGLQQSVGDPLRFDIPPGTFLANFAAVPGNDLATFDLGGWYFNLHTTTNPGGQLRGQITPEGVNSLRVEMTGDQEIPPVTTAIADNATAVGYFTYSDGAAQGIVANVQASGFSATAAHIHGGFAGENGNVVVGLEDVSASVNGAPAGTFFRTPVGSTFADKAATLNGGYYFNVHSAANPAGEVRGQIVTPGVQVSRVVLQTEQEIPAVTTPSANNVSGVGYFTVNTNNSFVRANLQANNFAGTAAHVHQGFAGVAGPVIFPLQDISASIDGAELGTFFRSDNTAVLQSLTGLQNGGYYFNVHSAANLPGEVRGQILLDEAFAVRVELETAQEIPAVTTPVADGIRSQAFFTANTRTDNVFAILRNTGFSATAAHIHGGFAGATGNVLIGLTDVSGDNNQPAGSVFQTPPGASIVNEVNLLDGGYYFNVHTTANAPGEVRGQITPRNVQVSRIEMTGNQEVPPVAIPASADANGVAFFTVNPDNQQLVANVRANGFTATAAHIHSGFAGANGPVIIPLNDVGTDSGTVFSTGRGERVRNLQNLLNGGYYINLHSDANAPGEVRGQIALRDVQVARVELEARQEVPPVTVPSAADAGAIAYLTINSASQNLVANLQAFNFPATAAHVHAGFAGSNGDVIFGLDDISASLNADPGTFFRSPQGAQARNFQGLLRAGYYFNAHSTANASGEVRGQIVTVTSRVLRAELNGTGAIPANQSPATGIGYLTVTDTNAGLFRSNVQLSGLTQAAVSVNTGGNNNVSFVTLQENAGAPGSFSSVEQAVRSLPGILNGAYSFEASGTRQ